MSTDTPDQTPPKTATETLAELVARRKAKAGQTNWGAAAGGLRGQERAAAARSASKSKPALRK